MAKVEEVLKGIKNQAIELEILDSPEFINYQDMLNRYSLDPDRK